MRFTSVLAVLSLFLAPTLAWPSTKTLRVAYSTQYDKKDENSVGVACSSTLIHKGYKTYGSLKNFPFIGGAEFITGANSDQCGTCWKLTYKDQSVNILAIDHIAEGFIISKEAMDALTDGEALDLGHVQAEVSQLPASACKF
ncbi:Cerato-platanin [Abortiporus biennis]|nr:Cerato-platanin [Abortiporus biennis]